MLRLALIAFSCLAGNITLPLPLLWNSLFPHPLRNEENMHKSHVRQVIEAGMSMPFIAVGLARRRRR